MTYRRERIGVTGPIVVAMERALPGLRAVLREGTLHEWAASHPGAIELRGRGPAYAVPLPGDDATQIVVRHSQHGGALAPVTRDRFLFPRAARELDVAVRLAAAGVRTPEIVAYVLYPAGIFRRSDVATRAVPRARDLGQALLDRPGAEQQRLLLEATAALIAQLGRAGARHPDLNVKNILLAPTATSRLGAWVLDVDRITFGAAGDPRITSTNLERFERSARKWRAEQGAPIEEEDLARLRAAVARANGRG